MKRSVTLGPIQDLSLYYWTKREIFETSEYAGLEFEPVEQFNEAGDVEWVEFVVTSDNPNSLEQFCEYLERVSRHLSCWDEIQQAGRQYRNQLAMYYEAQHSRRAALRMRWLAQRRFL